MIHTSFFPTPAEVSPGRKVDTFGNKTAFSAEMRVVGGSRAWWAAALSILLAPPALGLAPLFSDSIIEAPSHEIFSPSRLRLEHNRRNRASGALEASGALTDGALPVACPSNCSFPEGGFCDAGSGVCLCNRGWIGSACGEELGCLVEDCSGHGACVRGRCQCQLGYHGAACEEDACPLHCHASAGRGLCVHGTCACAEGWSGASCSQRPTRDCPVDSRGLVCSGHGSCGADGSCMCHHSDHSGLDCSYRSPSAPPAMGSCLRDGGGKLCGGASRGRCELDAHPPGCHCLPGFSGAACASDDCFTGNAEAAAAAAGVPSRPWGAAAAAVPCGGHGSCRAVGGGTDRWYCQCERGFVGPGQRQPLNVLSPLANDPPPPHPLLLPPFSPSHPPLANPSPSPPTLAQIAAREMQPRARDRAPATATAACNRSQPRRCRSPSRLQSRPPASPPSAPVSRPTPRPSPRSSARPAWRRAAPATEGGRA